MAEFFDPKVSIAIDLIRNAKKIVIFTGAGISTDSGIPDFRSNGGLWAKFDPNIYASYEVFLENPQYYWELEREVMSYCYKAKPNHSHKLITKLEKTGKIVAIITQNIDNLHQKSGSKVPIIELHGNGQKSHCMDCGIEVNKKYIYNKIKSIELEVPKCPKCNGKVKTDVVLFKEPLNKKTWKNATYYAENCDLIIVLGSSLTVFPGNQIPLLAKKAGAKLLFINKNPTTLDKHASLRLLGDLKTYLSLILKNV